MDKRTKLHDIYKRIREYKEEPIDLLIETIEVLQEGSPTFILEVVGLIIDEAILQETILDGEKGEF